MLVTVSRLIDELSTAGYVRRERDPADGRAWFAVLTDEGRAARRAAAPIHRDAIERHFPRHLTCREQQAITSALGKVVAAQR